MHWSIATVIQGVAICQPGNDGSPGCFRRGGTLFRETLCRESEICLEVTERWRDGFVLTQQANLSGGVA
jgi:hypothetical protein